MDMETQIKQALARGYCSTENEQKVLDPDLIEAMTRELLESFTPARSDESGEVCALGLKRKNCECVRADKGAK